MTTESHWKRSRRKLEPRPEQVRGMKLVLENQGARLFLHPGKGKTSIVLKAFSVLKRLDMVDALLVIAPLRVVTTSWPSELAKWEDFEHLTYTTIHGGKTERIAAMRSKKDVYLMNVEGLLTSEWKLGPKERGYPCSQEALKFLEGKRVMLAVDESTRFKNYDTARFKTIKKYLPYFNRVVIMTGTPQPKSMENLFSQCYLTDMGDDLGKFITHFRQHFMALDYDGKWIPQATGFDRVAQKIAPTTLQLRDEEGIPTETIDIWLPMSPELKKPYEEMRKEFITSIQGRTIISPNSGVLFGRLRQLAQGALIDPQDPGAWLDVSGAKLDALEGILEELDGSPLFALYAYRHDFARIEARLGRPVPRIGGGISAVQGAAYAASFGAGSVPLLLGHPQSVALGVDGLQESCNNILWFANDPSWENTYQANRRIARHGTKAEKVFIYRVMTECSVERAILEIVQGNQKSEEQFCEILRGHLS